MKLFEYVDKLETLAGIYWDCELMTSIDDAGNLYRPVNFWPEKMFVKKFEAAMVPQDVRTLKTLNPWEEKFIPVICLN